MRKSTTTLILIFFCICTVLQFFVSNTAT
jgi:di/tricarboxylate transporter